MVWTWWIRSPMLRNFLWNLAHPPVINLDLIQMAVKVIPQLWCVVKMLLAAVPGQPTLNCFHFSFWLHLPSVTEPMHCFLHCSYLSLGPQQVVTPDRLDFGSCGPWCWSCCFPFSESMFSFIYVNVSMQAVCHKSQCTNLHLPQSPTHGCVRRRGNVWWLLLHCLRLHFQDLGLPRENGENSFPSAGVAGLLKTSLKCQRMYL